MPPLPEQERCDQQKPGDEEDYGQGTLGTGFGGNGDWVPGNFTHPEPGFPVNPPWDVVEVVESTMVESGS